MVPEKSSIGEISSKISSSPDLVLMSVRPWSNAVSTRTRQASLPMSQSNESICKSSRSGTSMGSAIFANEIRPVGDTTLVFEAVREAANSCVLPKALSGGAMLPRMLNDPCQSETGRQMARANPQYRYWTAPSQEIGRSTKQSSQIGDCLGRDHTLHQPRDKGAIFAAPSRCPKGHIDLRAARKT